MAAFLVKEYQPFHSNFRSTQSLADYLAGQGVLGVEGLDTRALTRHIRNGGAMRAIISTTDLDAGSLTRRANAIASLVGMDLAREVTTVQPYRWTGGKPEMLADGLKLNADVWQHRADRPSVVAIDFGLKYNIARCLERVGFEVVVVPAATDASAHHGHGAGRPLSLQWPRRSGTSRLRCPRRSRNCLGPVAHLRHLSGQPDSGPGIRWA